MSEKIIIDGDWGGDEMQLLAVLIAHNAPVAGICTVFGNAPHAPVLKNALAIRSFLGVDHLPCHPGAQGPSDGPPLEGDGAHGDDGIGGVRPAITSMEVSPLPAADYILHVLHEAPEKTVTISATGPLTNLAQAWARAPETMRRVKEILIMGGCTQDIPAIDLPARRGNITPHAEFNFYMAASDANAVLSSGLPIRLFPMNCTQQLFLSAERAQRIRETIPPAQAQSIIAMMSVPAALDKMKFGAPPFMHDIHTAMGFLYSGEYAGQRGVVEVITQGERRGLSAFTPNENGPVFVQEAIHDPDRLFDIYLESLSRLFAAA